MVWARAKETKKKDILLALKEIGTLHESHLSDIYLTETCSVVVEAPKDVFAVIGKVRWDAVGRQIQQKSRLRQKDESPSSFETDLQVVGETGGGRNNARFQLCAQ
jgi:uncharacterized protein YgiM (DUF1202 family)